MDFCARLCCCGGSSYRQSTDWQGETQPLVHNDFPSISMHRVTIEVSNEKTLADLYLQGSYVSYHASRGWLLVDPKGREPSLYPLTESRCQVNPDAKALEMSMGLDGEPVTITIEIPRDIYAQYDHTSLEN